MYRNTEDGTGSRHPLLGDVGSVTPPYFDLDKAGEGRCTRFGFVFSVKRGNARTGFRIACERFLCFIPILYIKTIRSPVSCGVLFIRRCIPPLGCGNDTLSRNGMGKSFPPRGYAREKKQTSGKCLKIFDPS